MQNSMIVVYIFIALVVMLLAIAFIPWEKIQEKRKR